VLAGADVHICDRSGRSVLELAEEVGCRYFSGQQEHKHTSSSSSSIDALEEEEGSGEHALEVLITSFECWGEFKEELQRQKREWVAKELGKIVKEEWEIFEERFKMDVADQEGDFPPLFLSFFFFFLLFSFIVSLFFHPLPFSLPLFS